MLEVMFILRWLLSSSYRNSRYLFKRYDIEQMWACTALIGYTDADLQAKFNLKRRRDPDAYK